MKLGTQTGSIINHLMSRDKIRIPEIGMGATILCWSDRHAVTVTKVGFFKSGERKGQVKFCEVTQDKVTRVDDGKVSENQEYSYEFNPDGAVYIFNLTKNGWKCKSSGNGLLLGERDEYYDYSF